MVGFSSSSDRLASHVSSVFSYFTSYLTLALLLTALCISGLYLLLLHYLSRFTVQVTGVAYATISVLHLSAAAFCMYVGTCVCVCVCVFASVCGLKVSVILRTVYSGRALRS